MRVVVIGAGPTGLGSALRLAREGAHVTVVEASPNIGGLARSVQLWGKNVELGAHMLVLTDMRIKALWDELIGIDYESAPRRTQVLTKSGLLTYPFEPLNSALMLGPKKSLQILLGAVKTRLMRSESRNECSVRSWTVERFGKPAFEVFIRDYVEKLYGLPAEEVDQSFANSLLGFQRYSGPKLSLLTRFKKLSSGAAEVRVVRPKGGLGTLFSRMADAIHVCGSEIRYSSVVRRINYNRHGNAILELASGNLIEADYVVSTISLGVLTRILSSPDQVVAAASKLRCRSALIVYLFLEGGNPFPEQWIFVGLLDYLVCRVTNYSNWGSGSSKHSTRIISAEVWCNPIDHIWNVSTETAREIVVAELTKLGLLRGVVVLDAHVERVGAAFPVLRRGYSKEYNEVLRYLATMPRLITTGRMGTFNNTGTHESLLQGIEAGDAIVGMHRDGNHLTVATRGRT